MVSRSVAIVACVVSAVFFVITAHAINSLCGLLSPLALAIVFFYSLTKRFTHAAQFFLGLALAVSPVGAWIAVTGKFALPPLVLALGVLLWVAGFDIIYATQDVEIDRVEGLKSMVVLLGVPASLGLAQLLHFGMLLCLMLFGWLAQLGIPYATILLCIFCALIWEHRIAKRGDLDSIQRAFFLSNAIVGVLFVIGVSADCLLAVGLA
ncbi:MAG: 4-hydroxybenzoate octaprenyltransferase [Verrucomicrobia bacterium]|nr:MAG: 4-hydroxybenzoate octaprenyltransferase [Verrucomicrobiota bacterium]